MSHDDNEDDYDANIDNENEDDDDEDNKDEKDDEKQKKEVTWTKKPNWNDFTSIDLGKNMEMPDLEEIIKHIMKNFPMDKQFQKGPAIFGFSVNIGPDKKPVIKQLGRLDRRKKGKNIEEKPDALLDIIESNNEFTIVAEILDAEEKDIKVEANETELKISIDTPEQKYYREIVLPGKVQPKSAKVHCRNGILEVKIAKQLDE